jgi:hypothetical protein
MLNFASRKIVGMNDFRFLDALKCVKADIVEVPPHDRYFRMRTRAQLNVKMSLVNVMTRNPPLYPGVLSTLVIRTEAY